MKLQGYQSAKLRTHEDMESCVLFAKKEKVEAVKYIVWKISSFIHHYLPKGKEFLFIANAIGCWTHILSNTYWNSNI
jgi:hypothetical protein